ncbi:hypothetical protein [Mesorhizobium sp. WSM3860]|uniref:hypothetical protein n=1 Tax=Mesorhizobium sp. WSM3860 TaxID=2029403 RepID=UPI000BAF53BB|nr:hypothetical protein [Mesorhizobium sp. WSM3860]PBC03362.1 hypothetical protein CK220_14805 [Mesorhizobium sp. WSM3860]
MKISSLLRELSGAVPMKSRHDDGEIARWVVDPLSHPVLDAMSERELGDMPFRLTAGRTVYETACR